MGEEGDGRGLNSQQQSSEEMQGRMREEGNGRGHNDG